MNLMFFTIIAISAYLIAAILQGLRLFDIGLHNRMSSFIIGLIAVIIHGCLLHYWIDVGGLQNLSLLTVYSQVAWTAAVIILLFYYVNPVDLLAIISFPVAAVSILLVLAFPSYVLINTIAAPSELFHILLAFITISVLVLAAFLALLLALQERLLRKNYHAPAIKTLPPIEAMETLLFRIITAGFVLLTIVLISSLILFPGLFNGKSWQHTFIGILAWGVFAVLLYGHFHLGWRSKTAIYWTLSGVLILLISYFGVQLFLQLYD